MIDFCLLRTVPEPFVLEAGGTTASVVKLVAPAVPVWSGTADPAYVPGDAFHITSFYSGANTIDTTAFVWILVLRRGALPVLIHEQEFQGGFTAIDTLLGAGVHWSINRRVDGPMIYPIPSF